jgi:F-type H+-transporting ATPase subunit gamma
MPSSREIRVKINSIKNTKKITKAMEMVAASKMRKAQERMRAARPYGAKIRAVMRRMSYAKTEYKHPLLQKREQVKNVGLIVVTSDKGLCGGLNTNVLRLALNKMKEWDGQGKQVHVCAIGSKGFGFMQRMNASIASYLTYMGDTPHMEKLLPPVTVMLDKYMKGEIDEIHLCSTVFVNTMKQEPVVMQLAPISDTPDQLAKAGDQEDRGIFEHHWDYIYEPDAKEILDTLLKRYLEYTVYQAVAEHMASEQSARMVAMKAATDNAGNLIDELTLVYNKTRQAAITKELSEIVGGAAAV